LRRGSYRSLWCIWGVDHIVHYDVFEAWIISFTMMYLRCRSYRSLWCIWGVDHIVHYDVFEAWIISFTMMYLRRGSYRSLWCIWGWLSLLCLTSLSTIFQLISWWSILLVEETGVPEEYHRPVISHWQTLSPNVVSSTSPHERDSNSQR
jgi:hypothetical protein